MFSANVHFLTRRFLLLLIGVLLWSGCSRVNREIVESHPSLGVEDPQAVSSLLATLEQTNHGLTSFKGIARMKFGHAAGPLQSARAVFAGASNRKLRFDILSLSGQPATSVAYDGTWFYMAQHSENRFVRRRSPSADLERLLNIPIEINAVNLLLSGHVPIVDHTSAHLEKDLSHGGYTLVLKDGWRHRIRQRIYLKADMQTVWKFEMFDSADAPAYGVEIHNYRKFQGYRIPQQVEVTGGDGSTLVLEVARYWPNAAVEPSLFVLRSPQ